MRSRARFQYNAKETLLVVALAVQCHYRMGQRMFLWPIWKGLRGMGTYAPHPPHTPTGKGLFSMRLVARGLARPIRQRPQSRPEPRTPLRERCRRPPCHARRIRRGTVPRGCPCAAWRFRELPGSSPWRRRGNRDAVLDDVHRLTGGVSSVARSALGGVDRAEGPHVHCLLFRCHDVLLRCVLRSAGVFIQFPADINSPSRLACEPPGSKGNRGERLFGVCSLHRKFVRIKGFFEQMFDIISESGYNRIRITRRKAGI